MQSLSKHATLMIAASAISTGATTHKGADNHIHATGWELRNAFIVPLA